MTVVWGQRKSGELVTDVGELDGGHALIIGYTVVGDFVKFPDGHRERGHSRIDKVFSGPCPKCESSSVHYGLSAESQYLAECSGDCGFVWYAI